MPSTHFPELDQYHREKVYDALTKLQPSPFSISRDEVAEELIHLLLEASSTPLIPYEDGEALRRVVKLVDVPYDEANEFARTLFTESPENAVASLNGFAAACSEAVSAAYLLGRQETRREVLNARTGVVLA
jgi:hypothetical protein